MGVAAENVMFRWLMNWWYERNRRFDIAILWPICKERARDMDHARAAFAVHAFEDDAWLVLGEEEIIRRIGELK